MIKRFFQSANPKTLKKIFVLTVVAGCTNALLIVVINRVAFLVSQGLRPSWLEVTSFLVIFAIYYLCNRWALLNANIAIEGLISSLRTNIADKIRQSELTAINELSRGRLYSLLAYETNHLSVTFPILIENIQQTVLLAVAVIYLGYISIAALWVFLLAVALGLLIFWHINDSYSHVLKDVTYQQHKLLDLYAAIIHGSKEIRLHQQRSDEIMNSFEEESRKTEHLLTESGQQWTMLVILSAFVMYLMLGTAAFVFPHYIEGHSTIVFQLVPTLLFCFGPLSKVVAHLPLFIRAKVGLSSLYQMENDIDNAGGASTTEARIKAKKFEDFSTITFKDVSYRYQNKNNESIFTSGPWELEIHRGECIFFTGGNGSGKSTALRLISGLYPWNSGLLLVDDKAIRKDDIAGIREIFSTVFSDFHLFDRLYGLEHVDPLEVEKLLEVMDLSHKLQFENGRFTDIHLSTGQRKRLALITAILEDRPIYLLDEWAAEQDAHYKELFYKKILPDLKAKGKTIILVTHDDRYWYLADRIVKFDLGKIEWDRDCDRLSSD